MAEEAWTRSRKKMDLKQNIPSMKKVLLIEDDRSLRENLDLLLSLSGYTVLTANDGRNGIKVAISENPDIIVCDVKMPHLDGYGVIHILSHHPKTADIPFIFITGDAEYDNQRKGMSLGADDYLVKPINCTDLLNTISIRLAKNEKRKNQNNLENNEELKSPKEGLRKPFNLITDKHEIQYYKKKHMLYRVDQRPSSLYYVKSGKVKEFMINEEGKELITGIFSKGDFFGYTEIFKDCNYCKNAKVIEDASLVLIPKDEFMHKINTDNNVAREFIRLLSQNISEDEDIILNMAYNSLRKKVALGITRIIDKFSERKDGKSIINIPREDLSHLVGSSLESMIRTLKDFKNEKLIEIEHDGKIVVLDEPKIRKLRN